MKQDRDKNRDGEFSSLSRTTRDDSANQSQQSDSKDRNMNRYELDYFRRREKEIPSYSIVAILTEMEIFEPEDGTYQKVAPGQIGIASSPTKYKDKDYYEITFVDKEKYMEVLKEKQYNTEETEVEIFEADTKAAFEVLFASASFRRDQLLHLDSDVSFFNNSASVNFSDKRFDSTSKSLIEFFQTNVHKLINSAMFTIQFQPGDLVTILIDFMKEKDTGFTVDIYAGEIGIILDKKKDRIQMSDNSSILVEDVLPENASMVYFPRCGLLEIFNITVDSYTNFEPFTENNCMSINNAFLLSLRTEKN